MTKHKVFNFLSLFTIVSVLFGLVVFFGMLIWPVHYYESYLDPMPVLNNPIKPGEPFELQLDFCKYTDKVAHVTQQLEGNGAIIPLATQDVRTLPAGCYEAVYKVETPDWIAPGEYTLHVTFFYEVNPVRNKEYNIYTETIIIE